MQLFLSLIVYRYKSKSKYHAKRSELFPPEQHDRVDPKQSYHTLRLHTLGI